jgi:hypothetical protein
MTVFYVNLDDSLEVVSGIDSFTFSHPRRNFVLNTGSLTLISVVSPTTSKSVVREVGSGDLYLVVPVSDIAGHEVSHLHHITDLTQADNPGKMSMIAHRFGGGEIRYVEFP